jgi:hypothetical protein
MISASVHGFYRFGNITVPGDNHNHYIRGLFFQCCNPVDTVAIRQNEVEKDGMKKVVQFVLQYPTPVRSLPYASYKRPQKYAAIHRYRHHYRDR